MKRLLVLAASALVAFPDFAVGCFIAAIVGMVMNVSIPWWYLPVGGVLALLPDFDILIPIARQLLTGHQMVGNHRETTMLHRPLIILPAATMVGLELGGEYWAVTTFLCVFAHYMHDARETGSDGLAWFWPFSHKYWWVGGSYEQCYSEQGPWLENTWLKPSSRSVTELWIGTAAMCFVVSTATNNIIYGIIFAVVVWWGAFFTWSLWSTINDN